MKLEFIFCPSGILYALLLMTSVGWTTSPTPIWNVPSTSAEGWVSRPPVAQDAVGDATPVTHRPSSQNTFSCSRCKHCPRRLFTLDNFHPSFHPSLISSCLPVCSSLTLTSVGVSPSAVGTTGHGAARQGIPEVTRLRGDTLHPKLPKIQGQDTRFSPLKVLIFS